MTGKHTPTPWVIFKAGIGEENGDGIASLWREGDEREANAALIVRAVNAHEALVEALESLLLFRSSGDPGGDFERLNNAFQRDTGKMRPGKDVPAVAGDLAATLEEYAAWVSSKISEARAALALAGEEP